MFVLVRTPAGWAQFLPDDCSVIVQTLTGCALQIHSPTGAQTLHCYDSARSVARQILALRPRLVTPLAIVLDRRLAHG